MKQINNSVIINNSKERKLTLSLRGTIVSLFLYGVLGLLQVWPTEQIAAQNKLDYTGLPDSTAVAAYSLRKLSSTYTGPAIAVRRSSDNAVATVAFDGSNAVSASSIVTLQPFIPLKNTTLFPTKSGTITASTGSIIVTGRAAANFNLELFPGDMFIDINCNCY